MSDRGVAAFDDVPLPLDNDDEEEEEEDEDDEEAGDDESADEELARELNEESW